MPIRIPTRPFTTTDRQACIYLFTLLALAAPLGAGAGAGAGALVAQGSDDDEVRRSLSAVQLEPGEGLNLDGVVDEAFWARATPARDFIQRNPTEGAAVPGSTLR